jgi:threonine dehydrogenase-like Zn-dependent dehydrogenase
MDYSFKALHNKTMKHSNKEMTAVFFDGKLHIDKAPVPKLDENEILIKVTKAGICNTDHEIIRGYVPGFKGIPGHEFIGIVEDAKDNSIIGKRCTAEINCACGACEY